MSAPNPPVFCYMAEPIDQHSDRPVPGAAEINSALQYAGLNVFRPRTAFRCYGGLDTRVEQVNRAALYAADVLVACLPTGYPTIGVPAEIEAATARGIPALVYHDGQSMALVGNPLVTVVDTTIGIGTRAVELARQRPARAPERLGLVIADGWAAPQRTFADDAGIDLACTEHVTVAAHGFADLPSQVVAMELPTGYWGMVTGRSSTIRKRGVHIPVGVIDPGWRGPLYVGAYNLNDEPILISDGERLGQLILIPAVAPGHGPTLPPPIEIVKEVGVHARGTNGFGSSGA